MFKKSLRKDKKDNEGIETASEMNGNGPEEILSNKVQAKVKIIMRDVKLPDLETQTTR